MSPDTIGLKEHILALLREKDQRDEQRFLAQEANHLTITERITNLERRVARFESREEGMTLTSKLIIGAVGFLVTVLAGLGTAVGLYFTLVK